MFYVPLPPSTTNRKKNKINASAKYHLKVNIIIPFSHRVLYISTHTYGVFLRRKSLDGKMKRLDIILDVRLKQIEEQDAIKVAMRIL